MKKVHEIKRSLMPTSRENIIYEVFQPGLSLKLIRFKSIFIFTNREEFFKVRFFAQDHNHWVNDVTTHSGNVREPNWEIIRQYIILYTR